MRAGGERGEGVGQILEIINGNDDYKKNNKHT